MTFAEFLRHTPYLQGLTLAYAERTTIATQEDEPAFKNTTGCPSVDQSSRRS